MTEFTENVISIVSSIPRGKVATYGQIAKMAGSAMASRQVVRVLRSCSEKYNLPWHRVINSKGEVAIKDPEGNLIQQKMLKDEGVEVINCKVNLKVYRWNE